MRNAILAALGRGPNAATKATTKAETPGDDTEKNTSAADDADAADDESEDVAAEDGAPAPDDTDDEDDEPSAPSDPVAAKAYVRGRKHGASLATARIAAILTAPEAEANATLAAHLAFATKLSAKDAVATLKAGVPAKTGGLAARMAAANQPKLGGASVKPADPQAARTAARDAYISSLKR